MMVLAWSFPYVQEHTSSALIKNENIRGGAQVEQFGAKVKKSRLRWSEHVQRTVSGYTEHRMLPGRRKRIFMDKVKKTWWVAAPGTTITCLKKHKDKDDTGDVACSDWILAAKRETSGRQENHNPTGPPTGMNVATANASSSFAQLVWSTHNLVLHVTWL